MPFRSGYVCILGRPNAGKSTLLNAHAGEKLAIVSPKPQTTRNRVLGVINIPKIKGQDGVQIILIDTPGVHRADSSLGRKMMVEVREALEGCDLTLVIVDAAKKAEVNDEFLFDLVKRSEAPAFLLLNKIDLLGSEKHKLLPLIETYARAYDFREIIPISARRRQGLDVLLKKVTTALPAGPEYFPPDQITDQPVRFMAAELIREQVLLATSEEVPHSVTVLIEDFEEKAYPLKPAKPIEILNELIEANNLKQKDLVDVFGTPSIVSEVLHKKRDLNKTHIKKLSKRFQISPAVFF